ncbi:hypothetical protein HK405_001820 [Cladochytrium tenue]|nr:hypothetical protein HK405_001820 [Cladochytrium tenue]
MGDSAFLPAVTSPGLLPTPPPLPPPAPHPQPFRIDSPTPPRHSPSPAPSALQDAVPSAAPPLHSLPTAPTLKSAHAPHAAASAASSRRESAPPAAVPAPLPAVLGALVLFSVAGTLVRVKVTDWAGAVADAPVATVVYPQVVGCLCMGVAVRFKDRFAAGWYAMYVGITTGLCGSITTFSSWSLAVHTAGANLQTPSDGRSAGASLFAAALGVGLAVVAMAVASFMYAESAFGDLGASLQSVAAAAAAEAAAGGAAEDVELSSDGGGRDDAGAVGEGATATGAPAAKNVRAGTLPRPATVFRRSWDLADMGPWDWVLLCGGVAVWATLVVLCAVSVPSVSDERSLTAAMALGPLGTLLRYHLALWFNAKVPWFPLGTFAANMIGTVVIAVTYGMRQLHAPTPLAAQLWTAVADGFCGCLTTISTFVVELVHPAVVQPRPDSPLSSSGGSSRSSTVRVLATSALRLVSASPSIAAHFYFAASVLGGQILVVAVLRGFGIP